jgi:hypothetical protein
LQSHSNPFPRNPVFKKGWDKNPEIQEIRAYPACEIEAAIRKNEEPRAILSE